jgi:hypothetical protein
MTLRDVSAALTRTSLCVSNSSDPVDHCMADILIIGANALRAVETMRAPIVTRHRREQVVAKKRDGQGILFRRRDARDTNQLSHLHASRTRA